MFMQFKNPFISDLLGSYCLRLAQLTLFSFEVFVRNFWLFYEYGQFQMLQ